MNKQFTIFDVSSSVGDTDPVSPTNQLGDTEKPGLQRYLARGKPKLKDPAVHISTYSPNGRKTQYFRLNYRHPVTGKPSSTHIPGGNIKARLARYRVRELQAMIDRGASLGEIMAAITDYAGGGK